MNIVIYIYPGMTMLDAIGPYEVLRNIPKADIKFVAKRKEEIPADSQFIHLQAKYEIADIDSADVLLLPGSTIAFIKQARDKQVLDWIKKIHPTTQKTVSVCTGSIILAAAGLLEGKKATSHWKPIQLLSAYGAIPVAERFVEAGKIITAAGVSAGIDMALHLVRELRDEASARAAQLAIEYDPHPPFDSGNAQTADPAIIKLAEKQMEADAKKDLSWLEMVQYARALMKLKKI
ncbi:MAG: DJ-1/PfpI family protein [Bacteroidota bacterium]